MDLIHSRATSYGKGYEFLKGYRYTLGEDQLTEFGQQQMINSGKDFYRRYHHLALHTTPFIRSTDQDRVLESAQNWTQGFHSLRMQNGSSKDNYPYDILVIPEGEGINNTLSHGLCTNFENGPYSNYSTDAQKTWASIFTPPITTRLNHNLPNTNLTTTQTIHLMDLCPYFTIASPAGNTISPLCTLFTPTEWSQYSYYQTLGKYYSYTWGNPLGPTQGLGFASELISRLTNHPVHDHTSTNTTLDSSPLTFPLGADGVLYADFSHDNEMTAIFGALGLYNSTGVLEWDRMLDVSETRGFSSAWTVPFAGRAYFEKMRCTGEGGVEGVGDGDGEEFVRVIVNGRVLPLEECGGDEWGRCKLSKLIDGLGFVRMGGFWERCFD